MLDEQLVDTAQRDRFAADLARIWPGASGTAPFALAVSGGSDSLALMLLAHATFPGRFQVATVDHQLRRESADEAALVARLCHNLGVAHRTLSVTVAPGNLQEQARAARYEALAGWMARRGMRVLCTAHHADDQAETLVMRLNRGSGVRGLGGIRAASAFPEQAITVLRPLLGWRRSELRQMVARAGYVPVADPSNDNPRFERARVRAALADAEWIDPLALSRSARHLATAEEAIGWMVDDVWKREAVAVGDGYRWSACGDMPELVTICVLERGIALCGGGGAGFGEVARLVERLRDGGKATLAGAVITHSDDGWLLVPEGPRLTG